MIQKVTRSIAGAARGLFGNWRVLLLFALFYSGLLGTIYWFIATREGSVSQLLLTLLLALLAPVLFFIIQTMAVSYTEAEIKPAVLLRLSLREFGKLALMTAPIVLLAWLIIYLLGKLEPDASGLTRDVAHNVAPPTRPSGRVLTQPVQWRDTILIGARYLFLGVVLPLMAVHLWIGAAGSELVSAVKGAGRSIARAFRPSAVLIYALGALLFGVLPWFLVFTRTSTKSPWLEVSLLGIRLVAAAVLVLVAWLLTVGALRVNSAGGQSGDEAR